jgi:hypothetical protein
LADNNDGDTITLILRWFSCLIVQNYTL